MHNVLKLKKSLDFVLTCSLLGPASEASSDGRGLSPPLGWSRRGDEG